MKKYNQRWLMITFFCMVVGCVQSQTEVTFGAHYWLSGVDYNAFNNDDFNVKMGHLYGPYINLQYGKLLFRSSIFLGNLTFDYGDKTSFFDKANNGLKIHPESEPFSFDMKRTDLNFSLGYFLAPRLSINLAVKSISYITDSDLSLIDTKEIVDAKYSFEHRGFLYGGGISGKMVFPRLPLFIFWSALYLTGDITVEDAVTVQDQPFSDSKNEYSTETTEVSIGIGYRTPWNFQVMAGYRTDLSGGDLGEERIHGLVAALIYTLRP